MLKTLNEFIDKRILPWPVVVLTHRIIILITMSSMIPLVIWRDHTVFVLLVNSYLNVMAVAVSSIVLKFSVKEEKEHADADVIRDKQQYDLLNEINERLKKIEELRKS